MTLTWAGQWRDLLDSFEDGDLNVNHPDWSGWNTSTSDSADYVQVTDSSADYDASPYGSWWLDMQADGTDAADAEANIVRSSEAQVNVSFAVHAATEEDGRTRVWFEDGSGTQIGYIYAVPDGFGNPGWGWSGTSSGSLDMSGHGWYHFQVDFNWADNQAYITVDGDNKGPFDFDNAASGLGKIRCRLDRAGTESSNKQAGFDYFHEIHE